MRANARWRDPALGTRRELELPRGTFSKEDQPELLAATIAGFMRETDKRPPSGTMDSGRQRSNPSADSTGGLINTSGSEGDARNPKGAWCAEEDLSPL
jgi:hypothetical protein